MKSLMRVLVVATGVGLATQVFPQAQNPAWVDEMSGQAAETLNCEVGYLIHMREYDLGGRHVEEARLQCVDGRRYDASRATPDVDFTFKECGEQVC